MSDAGEGLVDAEARLQEQLDAREHEKRAHLSWDEVMGEQERTRERLLPLMIDPGEDPGWSIYEHWQEHGEQIAAFAERLAGATEPVRA